MATICLPIKLLNFKRASLSPSKAILLQPIKVTTVILVGIKTGLPIISELDQIQGNAGYDDARSSRHKNLSLFHLIGYQKIVVCPLFCLLKIFEN
jgi:hypothetical protein